MAVHRTTPTSATVGIKGSLSTLAKPEHTGKACGEYRSYVESDGHASVRIDDEFENDVIMPTTVQAQAFVMPNTIAHSRSGSGSGHRSPHVPPVMQELLQLDYYLLLGASRLLLHVPITSTSVWLYYLLRHLHHLGRLLHHIGCSNSNAGWRTSNNTSGFMIMPCK